MLRVDVPGRFSRRSCARRRYKPGDLLQRVDGINQTSPEMPAFAIGKTHRLSVYRGASAACREVEVHVPKVKATKQRPPIVEPRSVTHALLRPGMGLLKIVYFSGALGMRFTSELDRAVLGLKAGGCDRLIVNLRGNIGGSPVSHVSQAISARIVGQLATASPLGG